MKKTLLSTVLLLVSIGIFSAKAQTTSIPITLDLNSANLMTITDNSGGNYTINTTGGDPYVYVIPLTTNYDKAVVYNLSFEYTATAGLDDVEIFFGPPIQQSSTAQGGALSSAAVFTTFTLDMKTAAWTSGSAPNGYKQFRFDLGRKAGQTFTIKNIKLSSVPLPITLSSFTGTIENNAIKLNWTTVSEKDNKSFSVLRAGEDKVFSQIGEVAGAGNSDSKKVYDFRDVNPLSGNNYYKLLQTDYNGTSEEFGPVAVSTSISNESFNVSASADKNEVKVTLSSLTNAKTDIAIFNTSGSQLAKQSVNVQKGFNDFRIAIKNMQAGIYIITLTSNGEIVSKKFIKQ